MEVFTFLLRAEKGTNTSLHQSIWEGMDVWSACGDVSKRAGSTVQALVGFAVKTACMRTNMHTLTKKKHHKQLKTSLMRVS